jgi:RecJ-like exonuclease
MKDAQQTGLLKSDVDIRYFGRHTRPIYRLLQLADDPILPGLTGDKRACIRFLEELKIELKHNGKWRKWIDLTQEEKRRVISKIIRLLIEKGFGHQIAGRVTGEVYILPNEKKGSELRDVKEYATLLNSTARYGMAEVGLKVCLGDRDSKLQEARVLIQSHRRNLVKGMRLVETEGITEQGCLQFFHAGGGIRETIIGIITGMMLRSGKIRKDLPLIGFTTREDGTVKVSARATLQLRKKVDLAKALYKAAEAIGGVGGGHAVAAGATIPGGKEDEFLFLVKEELKSQLTL